MIRTSARLVLTGLAAVTLGAVSGWALVSKMPKDSGASTARASTLTLPDRSTADEPRSSAARPDRTASPAARTPEPAPTRVAAPAPPPAAKSPAARSPAADAPVAEPAKASPGKPQIRLDPGRGEASLEVGDSGLSADKNGRIRAKAPNIDVGFDPEEKKFKVRGPNGINFDIDW